MNFGERSLTNNIVELFSYTRYLITDIIFEMFVRSANHAYNRKLYSIKNFPYFKQFFGFIYYQCKRTKRKILERTLSCSKDVYKNKTSRLAILSRLCG